MVKIKPNQITGLMKTRNKEEMERVARDELRYRASYFLKKCLAFVLIVLMIAFSIYVMSIALRVN